MRIKFALSAGLIFLSGPGPAFADTAEKAAYLRVPAVEQKEAKIKGFKNILFKLVRQDEYLDEAIETIDAADGPLALPDISAIGFSLKAITENLNQVSALNKTEFSAMQPGSNLTTYTNAILSYSRKVNRKVAQLNGLVARLAAKNKKASMRDAVSSAKGGKPAKQSGGSASGGKVSGKKLTQLLDEQKAVERLSADVKNLRAASRNLNAASKWLYIASK